MLDETVNTVSSTTGIALNVSAAITEAAGVLAASTQAGLVGAAVLNEMSDSVQAATLVAVLTDAGFYDLADIIQSAAVSRLIWDYTPKAIEVSLTEVEQHVSVVAIGTIRAYINSTDTHSVDYGKLIAINPCLISQDKYLFSVEVANTSIVSVA